MSTDCAQNGPAEAPVIPVTAPPGGIPPKPGSSAFLSFLLLLESHFFGGRPRPELTHDHGRSPWLLLGVLVPTAPRGASAHAGVMHQWAPHGLCEADL